MNSLLYPLCSAVSLLALLYKARVLKSERSVTQLALVANFLFLFLIFAVSTPSVWVATSEFVGIVNFSGLLTQSCVVLMTACQQLVLLHLSYGPDVARRKAIPRVLALGLVLISMAVLFKGAQGQDEAPNDFAIISAQHAPGYLAVYLAAFTANQVEIGVMGWRYAKIAPSLWLRRGLRMVALTLPFALVYTGSRTADIVAAQLGASGHLWEPTAQVCLAIAVIVQTVGWILPDWGRHFTSVRARLRYWRAYRVLTPLHRSVTELVPGPVLPINPRLDSRTRLYRMVIEIRDAQWALRTWMDPEIALIAREEAAKAGLHGEAFAAIVEAAQLKGACEAKRLGCLPNKAAESPVTAAPGDLAAELAFQQRLARAMSSSIVLRSADRARTSITVGKGSA